MDDSSTSLEHADTTRARLVELLTRGAPRAPDRASLEAWGRAVGALLPRPSIVTLSGDLGVGKTTLARALCDGLGVHASVSVTSPTFALMQEYTSPRGTVMHVDLYRLKGPGELAALGWDEIVATASVLLIEWPDRARGTLPRTAIDIELRHDAAHADRRALSVRFA